MAVHSRLEFEWFCLLQSVWFPFYHLASQYVKALLIFHFECSFICCASHFGQQSTVSYVAELFFSMYLISWVCCESVHGSHSNWNSKSRYTKFFRTWYPFWIKYTAARKKANSILISTCSHFNIMTYRWSQNSMNKYWYWDWCIKLRRATVLKRRPVRFMASEISLHWKMKCQSKPSSVLNSPGFPRYCLHNSPVLSGL